MSSSTATTSSIAEYILDGYWQERGDPRVASMPFMGSFGSVLAILSLYALFVLYIGPRMMAQRKAFSLKPILIVYNIVLSAANGFFLIRYLLIYNWGADMFNIKFPSLEERNPKVDLILALNNAYTISKFIDLFDTIFFVVRKKQSQITGLHFFHHLTVPFISWTYFRLCGTNAYVIPFQLLNSTVHTFMYGYYGLSAMGAWIQPYLWWKRYLTLLQIIQFIILFAYAIYFTAFQEGYDSFYSYNLLSQSLLYAYLFTRFYMKSYKQQKQDAAAAKAKRDLIEKDLNNNFSTKRYEHCDINKVH